MLSYLSPTVFLTHISTTITGFITNRQIPFCIMYICLLIDLLEKKQTFCTTQIYKSSVGIQRFSSSRQKITTYFLIFLIQSIFDLTLFILCIWRLSRSHTRSASENSGLYLFSSNPKISNTEGKMKCINFFCKVHYASNKKRGRRRLKTNLL